MLWFIPLLSRGNFKAWNRVPSLGQNNMLHDSTIGRGAHMITESKFSYAAYVQHLNFFLSWLLCMMCTRSWTCAKLLILPLSHGLYKTSLKQEKWRHRNMKRQVVLKDNNFVLVTGNLTQFNTLHLRRVYTCALSGLESIRRKLAVGCRLREQPDTKLSTSRNYDLRGRGANNLKGCMADTLVFHIEPW